MRKAIELAKAGDTQMLKFLLDRLLPKERSVHVDLPALNGASNAVDALAAIIAAVRTGQIAPSEGEALASLVETRARLINDVEVNLRLDDFERRQKEVQDTLESLRKSR